MTEAIQIRGARLHNLKNIDLDIPKNQLIVLTGLSGSGKSTLGFDILLKESQRQYMEALGMLPFGLSRPPVDSLSGLPAAVSIDQHLSNHSPRSTVGTATDVYTWLRVLYARLGRRPCPHCAKELTPAFEDSAAGYDNESSDEDESERLIACPHCGQLLPELTMGHFSFNKPAGACPTCTGLGSVQQVNLALVVDPALSIAGGAVKAWDERLADYHSQILAAAAAYYELEFSPAQKVSDFSPALRDLFYYGAESAVFQAHFPQRSLPKTVRQGRFEGVATSLMRRYAERIQDSAYRQKMEALLVTQTCPDCAGTRLRPESRAVHIQGTPIITAAELPLTQLDEWLDKLPAGFSADELLLAAPLLQDLHIRLARLIEAGAGYLTLARSAPSLSAGESQRLRLAGLLGSELSGLLYVFDEPTIGLHQRDTRRLINLLRRLRNHGNTVLVIEHDLEIIANADWVVEFGPGAGRHGGQIVAQGTPAQAAADSRSLTGVYLSQRLPEAAAAEPRPAGPDWLVIRGARQHNLKNIDVRLPLHTLTAVAGVSGSGKSSLIFDILEPALRRRLYHSAELPGAHDGIDGSAEIKALVSIDQQPLTGLPRSNAATYTEVFSAIRTLFAAQPEARQRGFTARQFSFNVPGGRCERCQGSGSLAVQMHFLPDAAIVCPACHGRRFTAETLAVQYRGSDIAQVLEMTIEEAHTLFAGEPTLNTKLQILEDVGLGYLQLGQPADTLSGGEAQRVKLAKALAKRSSAHTLYLLDEPTAGLHAADTARLVRVLQRLVDGGGSVVVVEHNLELIRCADWVIELGPDGGAQGGYLLAEGAPEQLIANPNSITGPYLARRSGPKD